VSYIHEQSEEQLAVGHFVMRPPSQHAAMLNATRHIRTTTLPQRQMDVEGEIDDGDVMIWPTTAIQRSWMSCRMFSKPVESSMRADRFPRPDALHCLAGFIACGAPMGRR